MPTPATPERTFTGPSSISLANLEEARTSTRVRELRDTATVYDEFRREFTAILDTAVKRSVGIVALYPVQPAPVDVPLRYCSIDPRKRWRLYIDWAAYIADLKAARAEWETSVASIMDRLFKDTGTAVPTTPTKRALDLAGPPPQDWRVVALASMGDPWALGFQGQRTPAIVRVLGDRPFLHEQRAASDRAVRDDEVQALLEPGDALVRRAHVDEFDRDAVAATRVAEVAPGVAGTLDDEDAPLDDDGLTILGDDEDEAAPVLAGDADIDDAQLEQVAARATSRAGRRGRG